MNKQVIVVLSSVTYFLKIYLHVVIAAKMLSLNIKTHHPFIIAGAHRGVVGITIFCDYLSRTSSHIILPVFFFFYSF